MYILRVKNIQLTKITSMDSYIYKQMVQLSLFVLI